MLITYIIAYDLIRYADHWRDLVVCRGSQKGGQGEPKLWILKFDILLLNV